MLIRHSTAKDADDGEQSRNDGVHIGSQPRVEVELEVAGQRGVGRDARGEPGGEGRGEQRDAARRQPLYFFFLLRNWERRRRENEFGLVLCVARIEREHGMICVLVAGLNRREPWRRRARQGRREASIEIKTSSFSSFRFCRRKPAIAAFEQRHVSLLFRRSALNLLSPFNPSQLRFLHGRDVEATLCCKRNNSRPGQRSCSREKCRRRTRSSVSSTKREADNAPPPRLSNACLSPLLQRTCAGGQQQRRGRRRSVHS